jgi:ribosomal protein S18 acetylase RimI-like enzyme
LKCRDAPVDQQSVDDQISPPPGTTSMGILGDVVQDKLPDIPPFPGTYLVGTIGDTDDSKVTIRTSIPHSSDDTHIANLRLSVFSRFDEERQQMFRGQSIEVLNSRRKKGAVVLVAESESRSDYPYLNHMQSRIVHGHRYGEKGSPQREQRSGAASVASMRNDDAPSRQTERGFIVGSVECSHQEFRGTILGNARPEGSLMYVTEVAVRPDARRCGAGAMLMRGVAEVASLRNIESIYLHVDVTNQAALAMYEKSGYHYLDMREPMYAQFTASLNLHDGATHGRKHHLMCKNLVKSLTWLEDYDSIWDCLSRL